ncbi:MAG: GIY-YIG nuclease family protein [Alphaproteobacteria bacterium]|nr:GIY-YIG nuclease family protein [Alphaproteobacteria bacterium]
MKHVYILKSLSDPERFYNGVADDVLARLAKHNTGGVPHTSKFVPWALKTYVSFTDDTKAFAFEQYLKSTSGRAFAKNRL